MTMPNGAAGVNPEVPYKVTGNDGSISGMPERTEENVRSGLMAQKYPGGVIPRWAGKTIKPSTMSGMDASKITSGTFGDSFVPSVGALRDAIWQGYFGDLTTGHTAAQVRAIFVDIANRLEALEGP